MISVAFTPATPLVTEAVSDQMTKQQRGSPSVPRNHSDLALVAQNEGYSLAAGGGGGTPGAFAQTSRQSSDDLPLVSLLHGGAMLGGSAMEITNSLQSSATGYVRRSFAATAAPMEQREVQQPSAEASASASPLEMPILALDPKEFTRVTAARHKAKMEAFREAEQRQRTAAASVPADVGVSHEASLPEERQTDAGVEGKTEASVTVVSPPPPPQLKPLRKAETFSLPRSAFESDAEFVEDALRRFCVCGTDVVDWERQTWRSAEAH